MGNVQFSSEACVASVSLLLAASYGYTRLRKRGSETLEAVVLDSALEGFQVVVVGAGLAGLTAAIALAEAGLRVCLVEACAEVGGRVKQAQLGGVSVDLGGELFHGRSALMDWYDANGLTYSHFYKEEALLPEDCGKNKMGFYVDGKLSSYTELLPYLQRLEDMIDDMAELDPILLTGSLKDCLERHNVCDKTMELAKVLWASEECSTLDQMGVYGLVQEEMADVDDFENTYQPADTMRPYIRYLEEKCRELGVKTLLSWPVQRVEWDNDRITIRSECGQVVQAERLISTFPLAVLQSGNVVFEPPLPDWKQGVISRINMGPAAKIIAQLDRRVWPDGMQAFDCTGQPAPHAWFMDRQASDGTLVHLGVGFITGEHASLLDDHTPGECCEIFMEQVRKMFNAPDVKCLDFLVHDWTENKYIGGGYSSSSVQERPGDRELLRKDIDGKIYFAGEATCIPYGCFQSAVRTGVKAANEVLVHFKRERVL